MEQRHLDTIREMIYNDRQWLQDTYSEPDINTIKDHLSTRQQASFYLDTERKYAVFMKTPKSFKKHDYQKIVGTIDKNTVEHVIVITEDKPSTDTKKIIQELIAPTVKVEMFRLIELSKNLSKHALIPPHEIIRDQEQIQAILDANNIQSLASLSMILTSDFMARYLYAQKGELMKIHRDDGVCYRHVVEA